MRCKQCYRQIKGQEMSSEHWGKRLSSGSEFTQTLKQQFHADSSVSTPNKAKKYIYSLASSELYMLTTLPHVHRTGSLLHFPCSMLSLMSLTPTNTSITHLSTRRLPLSGIIRLKHVVFNIIKWKKTETQSPKMQPEARQFHFLTTWGLFW